jgi:transmembrane sensor
VSDSPEPTRPGDAVEQQAAAWVLRCDRGLTPAEQDEFSAWLAAHPRHGAQLARHRRHWRRLDALAEWRPEHAASPNPDLLAPPLRARLRRWVPAVVTLAGAAAAALAIMLWRSPGPRVDASVAPARELAANASTSALRVLEDGTKVELNRGAEFSVRYTPTERRVRLEKGEAHFTVTKNPARPFIVNAGGIDVRALGTAFNVRIDPAAVEVLVTEGTVQVDPAAAPDAAVTMAPPAAPIAVLEARQRAVVPLGQKAPPPEVATLTPGEIERVLAWQHRLLDFNATPLNEIVGELNRRNDIQLVVIDPELASIRVSATFRSDNIDGFVRLLEAGFGARAEKRGETEILLRKAK